MQRSIPAPIPLRPRSAPVNAAVPVAFAREATARVQIRPQLLIVDDCRFIAERVARALEARGYDATIAADGFEGLELLRERRFDLVVLDIDMPFVDGFNVLRQLRRDPTHADAPVLMLSAADSAGERERAARLGASGYMTKPLQISPLHAMVETLLEQ